jgi:hypothetical protein
MVRKIITIPYDERDRVETGALRINDDWKGLFIRGDDCIQFLGTLNRIINEKELEFWDVPFLEAIKDYIQNDVLT